MPIYKMDGKKDGLQKYRVRINYTDNLGVQKQLDRVAYGKDAAKELESRLMRDLKEETAKKITLGELAGEYLSMKKYEIRESSLDKIRCRLNYYVLPSLGGYRIDKLNTPILQKWKAEVEEMTKSTGERLSLRTKQSAYCELRAVLNYAVKMEYLPRNPLFATENFKDAYSTKKKIEFYTADEFLKFIAAAREQAERSENATNSIYEWNYYVFFNIAFYTGMRKGEIYALKWTDIDGDIIHVTKSITQKLRGDDRETPPKNKSSVRDIQIPLPLKDVLTEHYNRLKMLDGFSDDWRICGGVKCLRDSTIEKRNKKYASAAGLKKIRIHDFRHSHASYLAHYGINIQEIARRLGHSKVEMTWNTYSHLYPKEEDRAVSVLNMIGKTKKLYKLRIKNVYTEKQTA